MFFIALIGLVWSQEILKFEGVAKNPEGKVVYLEKHEVLFKKDKVESSKTFYLDPNSKEKIAELVSNYKTIRWVPDYYFKDFRFNRHNGIKPLNENKVEVFSYKEEKRKSEALKIKENMIGGQGFHYFIQDHLDKLKKGEKVKTKYILPRKLDYYSFILQKSDKRKVKEDEIHIEMKLDNILSLLISSLYMTYNLENKRLMAFYGESNLLNNEGEDVNVSIHYEYEKVAQ